MKELVSAICGRLHAGEYAMLCCILKADGSTPRGAGAKMAVFQDGTTLGTVGGGALERLSGVRAAELLREARSETREYRLAPDKKDDIGMVCGGDVLMGFYCCDPARAEDVAAFDALRDVLDRNGTAWIRTEFDSSGESRLSVIEREDIHSEAERLPTEPKLTQTEEKTVLLEPVARHETVYIFGGGHVGAALAPALSAVGFSVVVYDSRTDFVTRERFPTAKELVFGSFENALDTVKIAPEDYIVIMTPGHKADHMVLSQALRTKATYIGCIGSSKKVAYVNQKLAEEGFSEDDIARIHSPIGLPIKAQTPEEIAVSITAELILHRHT